MSVDLEFNSRFKEYIKFCRRRSRLCARSDFERNENNDPGAGSAVKSRNNVMSQELQCSLSNHVQFLARAVCNFDSVPHLVVPDDQCSPGFFRTALVFRGSLKGFSSSAATKILVASRRALVRIKVETLMPSNFAARSNTSFS